MLRFVMAKPRAGGNHPAMPYVEVPAFMKSLRAMDDVYARGCEFTILCWSRRDEVRLMSWREVDFDACVWRVPAPRVKIKSEHPSPLTKHALEILRTATPCHGCAIGR